MCQPGKKDVCCNLLSLKELHDIPKMAICPELMQNATVEVAMRGISIRVRIGP
jgi:hypothetical protein